MFLFYSILHLVISTILQVNGGNPLPDLPSWISENPAFKNPTIKDSIKTGNGLVSTDQSGNQGWLIHLNQHLGHGIEVELEELFLNPDLEEFLLISAWPMNADFKNIKLFTGSFEKPLKKLRIPNVKSFFVLYSASKTVSKFSLKYSRYGTSYEVIQPPTDSPIKKKETTFEIQLKGKPRDHYLLQDFSNQLKEELRKIARRYCKTNKIPFQEDISTENMVLIHKISFCPFEWPNRNICASIKHSIFVSGKRLEDIILNYQLTADHLRIMWATNDFPELEELGLTVYQLPATSNTIFYWALIVGLMIILSLIGTSIFWKVQDLSEIRASKNSVTSEVIQKARKPKLKLAKHQRVPSFMFADQTAAQIEKFKDPIIQSTDTGTSHKQIYENYMRSEDNSSPIKNYFGSILFSSNKAYEENEDEVELRPK